MRTGHFIETTKSTKLLYRPRRASENASKVVELVRVSFFLNVTYKTE